MQTKLTQTAGSRKGLGLFFSVAVWLTAAVLLAVIVFQSLTDWLNNAASDPTNAASAKIKVAASFIIYIASIMQLRPNAKLTP